MAKEIIYFFKLHDERKKKQEILALDFQHRVEKSQNGAKHDLHFWNDTTSVLALGEISCHFHPSDSTQYLYQ